MFKATRRVVSSLVRQACARQEMRLNNVFGPRGFGGLLGLRCLVLSEHLSQARFVCTELRDRNVGNPNRTPQCKAPSRVHTRAVTLRGWG